jgi:hypothetical protein
VAVYFGCATRRGYCRTWCAHTTSGREKAHKTTTIHTKKTNPSKKYATLRPRTQIDAEISWAWSLGQLFVPARAKVVERVRRLGVWTP